MGNRAALTLTHINVKELQKEKSVKISELSSPSSSSGHQMEFSMEVHLCQNYVSIATLCVDWLSFRLWTALQFWLNTFCFLPLNVWFQKLGCRFWQFDHHCKQLVQNSFIIMGIFKKLRSLVSKAEVEMIIHAFISSHPSIYPVLVTKGEGRAKDQMVNPQLHSALSSPRWSSSASTSLQERLSVPRCPLSSLINKTARHLNSSKLGSLFLAICHQIRASQLKWF